MFGPALMCYTNSHGQQLILEDEGDQPTTQPYIRADKKHRLVKQNASEPETDANETWAKCARERAVHLKKNMFSMPRKTPEKT